MFQARVSYFIRKAFSNIRAYLLVNFLSVVTIAIAIFIFSSYLLLYINLKNLLVSFGEEVQIAVYLDDFLTVDATENLKIEIIGIKEVEEVVYISKEEALDYLTEAMGGEGDILDGLSGNPLPASMEVKLKEGFRKTDDVAMVARKIERLNGVVDVVYAREWLSRFSEIVKLVELGGIIVGLVIAFSALAIIANTIKLTIYARRDEIEIMKIVGATNFFIKSPLVIEATIQGLLGSLIALGSLFGLYSLFMEYYSKEVGLFFGAMEFLFFEPMTLFIIILGGVFLGTFGSLISFGRLLKV